MKKIFKRIGICIAALPFLAIILWIGFELVGMMVNSLAASKQTRQIQRNLQDAWQNVTIIDTYSETGNTSGTGNHVDMSSVVAFKVDKDLDEIIEKMSGGYEFNATFPYNHLLKQIVFHPCMLCLQLPIHLIPGSLQTVPAP